jgi:hypothetical protein
MLIQTASTLWLVASLAAPPAQTAQPYRAAQPRRHFISISFDRQFIQPYGFRKHPLEELLGQDVNEVHFESFNYRTADGRTTATVLEYGKDGTGIGATVYPFGASVGATLAVRGSIESVPTIRVQIDGPSPVALYQLTGGRAMDVGAGVEMSDRSAGFGLGAHAFILGGIGRVDTDLLDGRRYWVEGGGGVSSGPFGVDLSFKYVVNQFSEPVTHSVHMIPINLRFSLTF